MCGKSEEVYSYRQAVAFLRVSHWVIERENLRATLGWMFWKKNLSG
jgi:hypothetical protein